jgi:hypothetical protein
MNSALAVSYRFYDSSAFIKALILCSAVLVLISSLAHKLFKREVFTVKDRNIKQAM